METLKEWLTQLLPPQRVLDLGCGAGSFDYEACRCPIIAVDIDFRQLPRSGKTVAACADCTDLPFPAGSFDLVVCHHSLEHFRDVSAAVREIRRVLKPDGRLFVSVPDGSSISDRLYRLMLAGGGHLQRFGFETVVRLIESEAQLHLAASKQLFSSFLYIDKRNFLPAPRGPLPGPFPRRMRWLGRLPRLLFSAGKLVLNISTRMLDRRLGSRLSTYGWALAFGPHRQDAVTEPGFVNVCMGCGAAFREEELVRFALALYRCPRCRGLNVLFAELTRRTDPSDPSTSIARGHPLC